MGTAAHQVDESLRIPSSLQREYVPDKAVVLEVATGRPTVNIVDSVERVDRCELHFESGNHLSKFL